MTSTNGSSIRGGGTSAFASGLPQFSTASLPSAPRNGPPQYHHHHQHAFSGMIGGGVPPFTMTGAPLPLRQHHHNTAANWLTFNDPPPQPGTALFSVSSSTGAGAGRSFGTQATTNVVRSPAQIAGSRHTSGGRGGSGGAARGTAGGNSRVAGHAQPLQPTENLFICYLPPSIDDHKLQLLVEQHGIVRSAKVMVDLATKQSRGFGFALMASCNDAIRARDALDGCVLESKRLQVRFADPPANDRPTDSCDAAFASTPAGGSSEAGDQCNSKGEVVTNHSNNNNTNLYVKGIPLAWTDENLSNFFAQYGPVASAVVLMEARESKGIGLVRYQHTDAVAAVLKAAPLRVDGWLQPITVRFSRQGNNTSGGQHDGGSSSFSKKQTTGRHRHVPGHGMPTHIPPEHRRTAASSSTASPLEYSAPLMHNAGAFVQQQALGSDTTGDWAPIGRQDTDAYQETAPNDDTFSTTQGPDLHGCSSSGAPPHTTTASALTQGTAGIHPRHALVHEPGERGASLPPAPSTPAPSAAGNEGTKVIPGPFGLLLKMHNPYYSAQRSGSNPSSPDGCPSPKIPMDDGSKRLRSSVAGGLTPSTTSLAAVRPPTHNFAPLPQSRRVSSGHQSPSGYFYPDPAAYGGHTCQYCQMGTTIRVLNVPNDTSQFEQWVDAHLSGFGPVADKEVYYNGTALITFVDAGAAHMAVEMLSHSGFEPELYDCSQGEYVG